MMRKWLAVLCIFAVSISLMISGCNIKISTKQTSESKSTTKASQTTTTTTTTSETEATTQSETTEPSKPTESTTAAATLKKGGQGFQTTLAKAKPIFIDTFADQKHQPAKISSAFYGQSVVSTRHISFTEAETGKGVHLDSLDSYVGYPAGIMPATEGSIRFAYKPDADLFKTYTVRQEAWRDYGSYKPPFMGFFLDTVGWNAAFAGGYYLGMNFTPDNTNASSISFGTWSGSGWSNTSADLTGTITWDSNRWYDIVIAYSEKKGKIAVYVDSYLAGEAKYNTPLSATEGFFLGQDPWKSGEEYWPYGPHALKGTYSNLRIYDQPIMD